MLQHRIEVGFLSLKTQEILSKGEKDGLEKKVDLFMKEASLLYKMCFEYLQKWTVSFNESDCFRWTNLSQTLSFGDVQSAIKYLRDRDLIVYDVKCFDQFCNLKTFAESAQNDEDFKSALVGDKGFKYLQNSHNADCHSEFLKTAEFFFCIPGHNDNVERIFSLMNAQWTDERNRFTIEAVSGILFLQYNLRDYSCFQCYKYLLGQPTLLREMKSSNKCAGTCVVSIEVLNDR
jgi:hypothetical protein